MRPHREQHLVSRIGWLRAAVLGANDGIVSTASLIIGVAASGSDRSALMVAGVAGLVAGAMSMAAGEYVSVSSQADTEHSDLARSTTSWRPCPKPNSMNLLPFMSRGASIRPRRAR
jgi:VIT1/CCC1 family predicted Fe2+/Mn2+ transporter